MKASSRSHNRRPAKSGPSISLFPFLAVLICTMGALVPLLLAMSRTARLQAEAAALAKVAEQNTEVQSEREMVQWRVEQLKQSRVQTESQLADARLELGHLEDHSRRLGDQLARYEKTMGDLERLGANDGQQRAATQAELDQLKSQIAAAQQQLDDTKKKVSQRKHSYAVIPYEGPNQTRRRPIYLECRADSVILRPEGIELTEADFDGPLGPGNPLAAALRAMREYLLQQRDFDPNIGEPYPMLLVRPEGINAYYAARMAMKSWGCDFGYELIGQDWKLSFPPPDPRLNDVVRQVVESARVEQAQLAAAAPRSYNPRPKEVYRAGPNGGFVREGGGSASGKGPGGYRPSKPSGQVARNYAPGGTGSAAQGSGSGQASGGGVPGGAAAGGRYAGSGGLGTGGANAGGAGGAYSAPGGASGGGTAGGAGGAYPGSGGGATPSFVAGGGSGGSASGNAGSDDGPELGNGGGGAGGNAGYGFAEGGGAGSGAAGNAPGSQTGNVLRGGSASGGGTPGALRGSGNAATNSTNQYADAGITTSDNATGQGNGDGNATPGAAGRGGNASAGGSGAGGTGQNNSSAGSSRPSSVARGAGRVSSSPDADGNEHGSSAGTAVSERPDGYVAGQPAREHVASTTTSSPPPGSRASAGRALRPGEWEPTPEPPPERPAEPKSSHKGGRSMAEQRGADWGLRNVARGSVGVTRPIRIECYADRLVVVSERGPAGNKVVAVGARAEGSMDTFISAVWEHIEGWGIAGRGMYWKPVLQIRVAPDAESRFQELATLLDGSGLMIERK